MRIVKQSEGEILNTDSFFESLAKIHRGSKFVYLCADDDDEDEGDESPAVVVFSDGEQMEEILESEYQRDHGTLKWVLSKLDKTMKSRDSKQQRLADLGGTSSMGRRGSLPLAQGRSVLSCDFTLSEEGSKAVEPLALTLVLSKASPQPPPKPVPVVRQPMKLAKLKSPAPMSLTSSKKSKFMTNTNYDVGKVEMPSTFMTQSCNGRIEQRSFLDQLVRPHSRARLAPSCVTLCQSRRMCVLMLRALTFSDRSTVLVILIRTAHPRVMFCVLHYRWTKAAMEAWLAQGKCPRCRWQAPVHPRPNASALVRVPSTSVKVECQQIDELWLWHVLVTMVQRPGSLAPWLKAPWDISV